VWCPPPPMQTQIQRMGGFCEHSPVVHELVAKFADMTTKETAKEYRWQLKEATAYQRHRIRQRLLATGAWRDFHENKIAHLPYVDPSTEYARTLRHLQAPDARWRAQKNRAQSYTLGTQGVGGSARGYMPFGGVPPPPQSRLRESGGDVSASLAERAAGGRAEHGPGCCRGLLVATWSGPTSAGPAAHRRGRCHSLSRPSPLWRVGAEAESRRRRPNLRPASHQGCARAARPGGASVVSRPVR
jgi:hypothetical protein